MNSEIYKELAKAILYSLKGPMGFIYTARGAPRRARTYTADSRTHRVSEGRRHKTPRALAVQHLIVSDMSTKHPFRGIGTVQADDAANGQLHRVVGVGAEDEAKLFQDRGAGVMLISRANVLQIEIRDQVQLIGGPGLSAAIGASTHEGIGVALVKDAVDLRGRLVGLTLLDLISAAGHGVHQAAGLSCGNGCHGSRFVKVWYWVQDQNPAQSEDLHPLTGQGGFETVPLS